MREIGSLPVDERINSASDIYGATKKPIQDNGSFLAIKNLEVFKIINDLSSTKYNNTLLPKNNISLDSLIIYKDLLVGSDKYFTLPTKSGLRIGTGAFPAEYNPSIEGFDYSYAYIQSESERKRLLVEMLGVTTKMVERDVNVVVYCDRGARPLSHMVAGLWSSVADSEMPKFFFINANPKKLHDFDATRVPDEEIRAVSAWIAEDYPEDNPFVVGNAKVCVLDENRVTGKTAEFVAGVVARAFPDTVDSIYCEWANVPARIWRDNPSVIGAQSVPGKFQSEAVASVESERLQSDLRRIAAETTTHSL